MVIISFVAPSKRIRKIFLFLGAVLLLVTGIPVTAKLVAWPLFISVDSYDEVNKPTLPIVVPTAGIYKDPNGRWWPGRRSVFRYQTAKQYPGQLFLVGANPKSGEPPEAEIIGQYFAQKDRTFTIVAEGRNSIESAKALKRLGLERDSIVHLVTSPSHTLRMAAVLRAQGFKVVASVAAEDFTQPLKPIDFIPRIDGISLFHQVSYEYFGIVLYLFRGDISLKHLF